MGYDLREHSLPEVPDDRSLVAASDHQINIVVISCYVLDEQIDGHPPATYHGTSSPHTGCRILISSSNTVGTLSERLADPNAQNSPPWQGFQRMSLRWS